MTSKPRSKNVKLSDSCSVADYRKLEEVQDREAIASFLEARFTERYLSPIQVEPIRKNGFTMMAIACLMIEALECFSQRKANSKRESARMFASFFRRWHGFSMFDPVSDEFYQHVRCGILHQAETTGGWRSAGPDHSSTTRQSMLLLSCARFRASWPSTATTSANNRGIQGPGERSD